MAPPSRCVHTVFRSAVLSLVCLVCLGCEGLFSTPIKRILDNPRDFEGKQVVIAGEVSDAFSLLVMKSFTLNDGTGQITVITSKALPKKGESLKVKGTVREAFALGDSQLIVIIEDDR